MTEMKLINPILDSIDKTVDRRRKNIKLRDVLVLRKRNMPEKSGNKRQRLKGLSRFRHVSFLFERTVLYMGIRFRRYHPQCKGKRAEGARYGRVIEKGVECEGKRGKHCPERVPKDCGAWAIDFRHPDGRWVSKSISRNKDKDGS